MENIDYSIDVQKLYLELFLVDRDSFIRCQSIFDFTLFDKKLQPTAKFIHDYVNEYSTIPNTEIVHANTKFELQKIENINAGDIDWLLDSFELFTRHKALERAIVETYDLLSTGEYAQVEHKIKKAVQITLQKDLGTDYFSDPLGRLERIKSSNGQMSCGWAALDKLLYGGFNRGELEIFAGGSGCVGAATPVRVIRLINI